MEIAYTDFVCELKKVLKNSVLPQCNDKQNSTELFNLLLNNIFEDNQKKIQKKARKNIIYENEITKNNILFGVVVKRSFLASVKIDENLNMVQKYKTRFDAKIVIIDSNNEIDNLMFKRFSTKNAALNYAKKLSCMLENNNLNAAIAIISKI